MVKLFSATLCAALAGTLLMSGSAEARRLHFWWQHPDDVTYNRSYDDPSYYDQQDADVADQFNQDQYDRYMRETGHSKRKRVVDNTYYDPQVEQPTYKKAPAYRLKKPAAKVATVKPVVKSPSVATAKPAPVDKPVQVASIANRLNDKAPTQKIDCTKGAPIVSGYGFSDVTSKTCSGGTLTYAATRSGKSKELLTELMPRLLTALARSGDADLAFLAFDKFIAGLPAGVQLFSMLKANPNLLDLIATILGTAPRLAEQLSARPRVLDAVLDPGFFDALPRAEEVRAMIASAIPESTPLDEVVDRVRIIGSEQMFRVGVRVLS